MSDKAVIYCRVSSTKQRIEGDGLASQEVRCREYARMKGYDVAYVFKDDASGGLIDRPGMQAMLAFLRGNRRDPHVVIIDDISRLARGLEAHLQLRAAINKAGGVLESPSIEFGEDSDSQLAENLLASISQHHRQKNGEQTRNRMRGRMLNGYWVFAAPIGYKYERVGTYGKLLVRNEPLATIVQQALEGFASGQLASKTEVARFLAAHPPFPTDRRGEVFVERVTEMFSRITYAGHIEMPEWDVSLRKGHHEPLVSLETWQRVQERLNGKSVAPARIDTAADFPLRGFVLCSCCNQPLTAAWSKGRSASYPYYLCYNRGCPERGKSIPRSRIEGEFEELLQQLAPSPQLLKVAAHLFRDLWDQKMAASHSRKKALKAEVSQIERKIDQLLDLLIDADHATDTALFKKRMREQEQQKALLEEKIARCGTPLAPFDESFRTAMDFLGNPQKMWVPEALEDKRALLKLACSDHLVYVRNEGLRTAEFSFLFNMLGNKKSTKKGMVRLTGGEHSLRPELLDIALALATVPGIRKLAMTTNGYRLPARAADYAAAGISALNISVDSLDPARFAAITGHDRLGEVRAGIDAAHAAGIRSIKLNSVLNARHQRRRTGRFMAFVAPHDLSLRFIEVMRTNDNPGFFARHHLADAEIADRLAIAGWRQIPREAGAGPAVELANPSGAGRIAALTASKVPAHRLHDEDSGTTPHLASIGG